MHYKLYKDGCWDILGENIQIYHAYPAINGSAISPVSVSMGEDVLQYQLEEGSVKLRFSRREKAVEVSCTLHGISGIHDIEPIANAKVKGAENVFVQGFGMEGPSGCRTVGYEMLKSNGLISLYQEQSALFIYALDHRHYVNRYCVGKTQSLFADDAICLFGGFNLENTQGDERMLPSPPVFHWCSWYYLYQNLSQDLLEEYLGGFQTEKEIPFRYIQIDAGYAPSPGDWLLPNHLFPEGLKKAAESIIRSGYEPGIWVAPFIVGDQSELFRTPAIRRRWPI